MTTPNERFRALAHFIELLDLALYDESVPGHLRATAASIRRTFPDAVSLKELVDSGRQGLSAETADIFQRAVIWLNDLGRCGSLPQCCVDGGSGWTGTFRPRAILKPSGKLPVINRAFLGLLLTLGFSHREEDAVEDAVAIEVDAGSLQTCKGRHVALREPRYLSSICRRRLFTRSSVTRT